MIIHLTGTVISKSNDYLVLNVSGVGYQVFVPETALHKIPISQNTTTIYTLMHIREDAQTLFGFPSMEDRQFFITLTSVSGVGPKIGLKMLSALSTMQIVQAIIREDIAVLTSVSGVGKKMAERLIVELKDKLPNAFHAEGISTSQTMPAMPSQSDDLFMAMKTLGYSTDEIKRAYHKAAIEIAEKDQLEDSIKVLLKHL
jgi:holliday junction DNA helicase RuvA